MFSQFPLSGAPFSGEGEEVLHSQVTPSAGSISVASAAPDKEFVFRAIPQTGSINTGLGWGLGAWNGNYGWGQDAQNTVPIVIQPKNIIPAPGALTALGEVPTLDFGITPAVGALNVVGISPSLDARITPQAGAITTGLGWGVGAWNGDYGWGESDAPFVVVSVIKTPDAANLSVIGYAPGIRRADFIRPASANLVLLGSIPVLKNPNWTIINDNQTPSWLGINDSQTANWGNIDDSQLAGWVDVDDSQSSNWVDVDDTQSANWNKVAA